MIFVDSSFFFALASEEDPDHERVIEVFQEFDPKRLPNLWPHYEPRRLRNHHVDPLVEQSQRSRLYGAPAL